MLHCNSVITSKRHVKHMLRLASPTINSGKNRIFARYT